jgi:PGF-CTERM protein
MTLTVDVAAPASDARGDHTFQVTATSADGTTSATTGDLTVTVTEKVDATGGPTTDEIEEDDSPGFGIISAIAALGAVLLIRRRL